MKTYIATVAGFATATLFAVTAQADEMKSEAYKADTTMKPASIRTVKTIDADGEVSMKTVEVTPTDMRRTAVLSALEVQNTDAYVVADADGDLYINHLKPIDELPDPTLSVETLDTIRVEYQGMTFTNRIVSE